MSSQYPYLKGTPVSKTMMPLSPTRRATMNHSWANAARSPLAASPAPTHNVNANPRVSPIPRRPIDRPVFSSMEHSPVANMPASKPALAQYHRGAGAWPQRTSPPGQRPGPITPVKNHDAAENDALQGRMGSHAMKIKEVADMKSRTEQLRKETATLRKTLNSYAPDAVVSPRSEMEIAPPVVAPRQQQEKSSTEAISKLTDLVSELRTQLDQARSEDKEQELWNAKERIKALEMEQELGRLESKKPAELLAAESTIKSQNATLDRMRSINTSQQEQLNRLNAKENDVQRKVSEIEELAFQLKQEKTKVWNLEKKLGEQQTQQSDGLSTEKELRECIRQLEIANVELQAQAAQVPSLREEAAKIPALEEEVKQARFAAAQIPSLEDEIQVARSIAARVPVLEAELEEARKTQTSLAKPPSVASHQAGPVLDTSTSSRPAPVEPALNTSTSSQQPLERVPSTTSQPALQASVTSVHSQQAAMHASTSSQPALQTSVSSQQMEKVPSVHSQSALNTSTAGPLNTSTSSQQPLERVPSTTSQPAVPSAPGSVASQSAGHVSNTNTPSQQPLERVPSVVPSLHESTSSQPAHLEKTPSVHSQAADPVAHSSAVSHTSARSEEQRKTGFKMAAGLLAVKAMNRMKVPAGYPEPPSSIALEVVEGAQPGVVTEAVDEEPVVVEIEREIYSSSDDGGHESASQPLERVPSTTSQPALQTSVTSVHQQAAMHASTSSQPALQTSVTSQQMERVPSVHSQSALNTSTAEPMHASTSSQPALQTSVTSQQMEGAPSIHSQSALNVSTSSQPAPIEPALNTSTSSQQPLERVPSTTSQPGLQASVGSVHSTSSQPAHLGKTPSVHSQSADPVAHSSAVSHTSARSEEQRKTGFKMAAGLLAVKAMNRMKVPAGYPEPPSSIALEVVEGAQPGVVTEAVDEEPVVVEIEREIYSSSDDEKEVTKHTSVTHSESQVPAQTALNTSTSSVPLERVPSTTSQPALQASVTSVHSQQAAMHASTSSQPALQTSVSSQQMEKVPSVHSQSALNTSTAGPLNTSTSSQQPLERVPSTTSQPAVPSAPGSVASQSAGHVSNTNTPSQQPLERVPSVVPSLHESTSSQPAHLEKTPSVHSQAADPVAHSSAVSHTSARSEEQRKTGFKMAAGLLAVKAMNRMKVPAGYPEPPSSIALEVVEGAQPGVVTEAVDEEPVVVEIEREIYSSSDDGGHESVPQEVALNTSTSSQQPLERVPSTTSQPALQASVTSVHSQQAAMHASTSSQPALQTSVTSVHSQQAAMHASTSSQPALQASVNVEPVLNTSVSSQQQLERVPSATSQPALQTSVTSHSAPSVHNQSALNVSTSSQPAPGEPALNTSTSSQSALQASVTSVHSQQAAMHASTSTQPALQTSVTSQQMEKAPSVHSQSGLNMSTSSQPAPVNPVLNTTTSSQPLERVPSTSSQPALQASVTSVHSQQAIPSQPALNTSTSSQQPLERVPSAHGSVTSQPALQTSVTSQQMERVSSVSGQALLNTSTSSQLAPALNTSTSSQQALERVPSTTSQPALQASVTSVHSQQAAMHASTSSQPALQTSVTSQQMERVPSVHSQSALNTSTAGPMHASTSSQSALHASVTSQPMPVEPLNTSTSSHQLERVLSEVSQPALQASVTSQVPSVHSQAALNISTSSQPALQASVTSVSSRTALNAGNSQASELPALNTSTSSQPHSRVPSATSQPALQTSTTSVHSQLELNASTTSQPAPVAPPVLNTSTSSQQPTVQSEHGGSVASQPELVPTAPTVPMEAVRHEGILSFNLTYATPTVHTHREEELINGLDIGYEKSIDLCTETDRSMSHLETPVGTPGKSFEERMEPVFYVAAMIGEAGGAEKAGGLMSLVQAAPTPQEMMRRTQEQQKIRKFENKPLDLHLTQEMHHAVKECGVNAEEYEADGLRVLRLSSPRSKMRGLNLLHQAGYKIDPNKKNGIKMLLLSSPRRTPGLELLQESLAEKTK